MAIYVYQNTSGILVSWIPEDLTIAEAQANGQLASNAALVAGGNRAKDNLPPLDDTHEWDPATKTVIVVPAPTPVDLLNTFDFIMAFTPAELAGVRGSSDNEVQQFLYSLEVTQGINLNHDTIKRQVNYMVGLGLLTSSRASAILSTVDSGASYAVGRE
jgi:hypothetical protein